MFALSREVACNVLHPSACADMQMKWVVYYEGLNKAHRACTAPLYSYTGRLVLTIFVAVLLEQALWREGRD